MPRLGPFFRLLLVVVLAWTVDVVAEKSAGSRREERRTYNLPAGDAAETLKSFASLSGEQIVYLVANVRGVHTRNVVGKYSAREALTRMIAGSALVVSEDPSTGAFFVGRKRSAPPAADAPGRSLPPDSPKSAPSYSLTTPPPSTDCHP